MGQYHPTADLSADEAPLVRALLWPGEEEQKEQLELPAFPFKPPHEQKIYFPGIISLGAITGRAFFLSAIDPVISEPAQEIEYAKEMLNRELFDNKSIVSSWHSWDEEERVLRLYTFTSTLDYDLETLIFRVYSHIAETYKELDFELRVIPLHDEREDSFLPPNSFPIFTN